MFQINEISAFIDGTLMYGPNKAWTDAIRSFKDGRLLVKKKIQNSHFFTHHELVTYFVGDFTGNS